MNRLIIDRRFHFKWLVYDFGHLATNLVLDRRRKRCPQWGTRYSLDQLFLRALKQLDASFSVGR